ncbi:hypothetical protein M409DRAFT_65847 [Zasmidium cellare ATCC 36951]|uniref:Alpha/beta hydrolase fold-3 domain-containing protein n=1 Tax=Zasmidium cellare ATCC 36951 TaxID=1080233 RepID=A0A6A6CKG7_ZASCE|nr:uncharacterized protein M409DRAFT_65847 [Zasmidium cellare ATCC 36951]KAF2167737.1 hypothetical protein M409DRAFT_65847 [Zasmidium cellare ATCC 36951]
MPFNTFSVATAVTPSVIETYFSHYLNRRPLKQKPTAHISYHEGLRLIRQFLDYSSKHSIEDLQAFTSQWVPAPTWVRLQDCEVPPQFLQRSANVLRKQLGSNGLEKVGGSKWWTWRRSESPLHAEWIEMKKDYNERKRAGTKCDRVILYIHGGAYYFGSVDEHRYQMQRHARKLKARLLAPRYRLAPQFPFPCGLYDCIATYFYLLEHFEPNQILFAGDSAGGGMVLGMLVVLRDQGCPLPAGTILLSPWVDLTHSFPSTSGDGVGDYIPPHGFHHKPSMAWPPPASTEEKMKKVERKFTQPIDQPFEVVELPATVESGAVSTKASRDNLREAAEASQEKSKDLNQLPGFGEKLEIEFDNKLVQIREQIQMYSTNELLTHPLVSPVQQPSLGGLPPMLIQVGGAELLRDEQIYLAHKAANPRQYVPSEAVMNEYDPQRIVLNQYPPTDVQLQVWEDLCHVPHTLSFTRPAKYMYRAVAQFGAWALARAQNKGIEILDDDAISVISNGSENEEEQEQNGSNKPGSERKSAYGAIGMDGVTSTQFKLTPVGTVGKAGDELPPFKEHMIRQRVNRHGSIFPLPHTSEIACLKIDRSTIGTIKPGPVRKWLAKRSDNEQKFASEYKRIIKKRQKEMGNGYDPMEEGEYPPPTALINRRRKGVAPEEKKKGKSWGLAMWSGWGSSHDESTIQREEKALNDKADEASVADRNGSLATTATTKADTGGSVKTSIEREGPAANKNLAVPGHEMDAEGKGKRRRSSASMWSRKEREDSRPRSPYRQVRDVGQAESERNSVVSPILGGSDGGSPQQPPSRGGLWDVSRRSSQTSGKLASATRPVSVAAASSLAHQAQQTPQSPTLAVVPTISDTGKDAVKVPGTDATYLNPESSRPHNGTVAYPFKLKDPQGVSGRASPNPSTMTLDSNEQSDKESARESMLLQAGKNDGVSVEPRAAEKQGLETAPLGTTPVVPLQTALGQPETNILGRPVSMLSDSPALRHLKSPDEDPVSPISDTASSSFEHSAAATATTTNPSQKQRHNKFESRDSRLGFLGADGMPTSAFPEMRSQQPENGADAPKAMPFKIRNPVFDPRVAPQPQAPAAPVSAPAPEPQQQPGTTTETAKAAPFKMRHTIYDPKIAPPGTQPPGEQVSASNGVNGHAAGEREVTPPSSITPPLPATAAHSQAPITPPASDTAGVSPIEGTTLSSFPQPANFSHPTVQPARPIAVRLDSNGPPPPPPPKDDPPAPPVVKASPSTDNLNGNRAPMIGDLSFERKGSVGFEEVVDAKTALPPDNEGDRI